MQFRSPTPLDPVSFEHPAIMTRIGPLGIDADDMSDIGAGTGQRGYRAQRAARRANRDFVATLSGDDEPVNMGTITRAPAATISADDYRALRDDWYSITGLDQTTARDRRRALKAIFMLFAMIGSIDDEEVYSTQSVQYVCVDRTKITLLARDFVRAVHRLPPPAAARGTQRCATLRQALRPVAEIVFQTIRDHPTDDNYHSQVYRKYAPHDDAIAASPHLCFDFLPPSATFLSSAQRAFITRLQGVILQDADDENRTGILHILGRAQARQDSGIGASVGDSDDDDSGHDDEEERDDEEHGTAPPPPRGPDLSGDQYRAPLSWPSLTEERRDEIRNAKAAIDLAALEGRRLALEGGLDNWANDASARWVAFRAYFELFPPNIRKGRSDEIDLIAREIGVTPPSHQHYLELRALANAGQL